MVEKKVKRVNPNKFYWNPETREKIHVEYMDGTKITLNEGQKKKAEEAKAACTRFSKNEVANNNIMKRKPEEKRGAKPKETTLKAIK